MHGVSECLQTLNQTMPDAARMAMVEVGGAKIGVVGLSGEEVRADRQDGVADGSRGLLFASTRQQAPIRRAEGGVSGPAAGVGGLDQWIDKLNEEGVGFLEEPYRLGDTRAVMISGPSQETIELVEGP